MEQKPWLWKKRPVEKTLAADKGNNSLSRDEDATEELLNEKELERDVRLLNDKLSSALFECNSKDNIVAKQVKIAQEAIAGWEKAEARVVSLKKELDGVLEQKAASEERLSHLDSALKECMQQLRFVREDQEMRVCAAVVKTSEELEKSQIASDDKLIEADKMLSKLNAENIQLNKALSGKDKVIEELSKHSAQVEADLNALILRVESTEKENASLKYEVRVLEKELEIRNEEREFDRRTADVAQKKHQECMKKIAILESECQRLRLLVRKRLPGPATVTKMKNEVGMLGKDQVETRRRKSNPSLISSMDFRVDVAADSPSKRTNFLTEQLHKLEEENMSLKYALNMKSSDLQLSRIMYARAASRLSQGKGQVQESLRAPQEPGRDPILLHEHSLATPSDIGSDGKASFAESWASVLMSELEHIKNEKQSAAPSHRNMGTLDMNLMDDFAEMEKLAIVSIDYPAGSSQHSSEEGNAIVGSSGSPYGQQFSPSMLTPVNNFSSKPLISGEERQSYHAATNRVPKRLDELLKVLLEHSRVSERNPLEVLEDIKVALVHNSSDNNLLYAKGSTKKPINLDTSNKGNDSNCSTRKKGDRKIQSNMSISLHKILELLQGINVSQDDDVTQSFRGKNDELLACKNFETQTGYMVRVFQWKTAELYVVLRQLVQTCNDLLNGTAELEQFVESVAYSLDWLMNHCFSLQDVSSMKDAIRSHLDWDGSRSESEIDSGSTNHSAELSKFRSQIVKGESFKIQVQDSKELIEKLKLVIETSTQSEGKTGDEMEKQKMVKENIDTQLMDTDLEQRNACQKISHLEDDLENRQNPSKRLEGTHDNLKIQPKSMTGKEAPEGEKHWEKRLRNDWEITAASEKLAVCQETILNLGKQLHAMASPRDAAILNKIISEPTDPVITSMPTPPRNVSPRLSLLDKMLAEDGNQIGASAEPKDNLQNGNRIDDNADKVFPMAIVPVKKKEGRSFLKKLFSRKKNGNSKKILLMSCNRRDSS